MRNIFQIVALFAAISFANTDDTRCANETSETMCDCNQAAIITTLLNNAKNLLDDAKSYAVSKTSCSIPIDCAANVETNSPTKSGISNLEGEKRHEVLKTNCSMPIDCAANVKTNSSTKSGISNLEDEKSHTVLKINCPMPMDCAEILDRNPKTQSGIYQIWPRNRAIKGIVEVYCDMDDDGGAWTVLQRRGEFGNSDQYFYQDWVTYKRGFGDLNKDFWLGNDKIFAVTNQRLYTVKFVLSDFEGNTTYAIYDDFWIDDESRNYKLHVSEYRGTAGDSFSYHDGAQFSTKDRDNDNSIYSCAISRKGAWWFRGGCQNSNLNGEYLKGTHRVGNELGVNWYHFRGDFYSLKDTVIKIRPSY